MKNKTSKFLAVGALAVGAFIMNGVLQMPSLQEYKDTLSSVISAEHLDVTPTVIQDDLFVSSARLSNKAENTKINAGFITTNVLKAMAPIDYFKANTKGVYEFIALHEYSHAQLHYLMKKDKEFFNVQFEGVSKEQQDIVNERMSNYFKNNANNARNFLTTNLHENFADSYASVLMIRDFQDKYSDKEIRNIIQARHSQVKRQNEMMFGAFGDLEHRSDLAIKDILDTPFEKIREMSPKEAQDFTLKIASQSTLKKFDKVYSSLMNSKQFGEGLDSNTKESIKEFKLVDAKSSILNMKNLREKSLATADNSNKFKPG